MAQNRHAYRRWSISADEISTHAARPHFVEERLKGKSSLTHEHGAVHDRRCKALARRSQAAGSDLQRAKKITRLQQQRRSGLLREIDDRLTQARANRSRLLLSKSTEAAIKCAHVREVAQRVKMQEAEHKDRLQQEIEARMVSSTARRERHLQATRLEPFHGKRNVAATSIQSWWRWVRIAQAVKLFRNSALGKREIQDCTFEEVSSMLRDKQVLCSVGNLFRPLKTFLHASERQRQNTHRVFLSSFMVCYFPETVFSAQGAEEQALRASARDMLTRFYDWVDNNLSTSQRIRARELMGARFSAFKTAWNHYTIAFEAWKQADEAKLIQGLIAHYLELVNLKHTVSHTPDSPQGREWFPHIQQQQQVIRHKLRKLKAVKALEEINQAESDAQDHASSLTPTEEESYMIALSPSPKRRKTSEVEEAEREQQHTGVQTSSLTLSSSPIGMQEQSQTTPLSTVSRADPSSIATPTPPAEASRLIEGLVNAQLAHEIALDDNFKITQPQAGLETQIQATVERAMVDVLRQELSKTPPDKRRVPMVVENMREGLLAVTLERHVTLRERISANLDPDMVAYQVEHDAFDIDQCRTFIADMISYLCAPERDGAAQELRETEDFAAFFEQARRLLKAMKLDLINFHISTMRPYIKQYAVEYERSKFQQVLDAGQLPLQHTRAWLSLGAEQVQEDTSALGKFDAAVLLLLQGAVQEVPETFTMDAERMKNRTLEFNQLVLVASVYQLVTNFSPALRSVQSFAQELVSTLLLVMEGEKDLFAHLPSIAIQATTTVNKALTDLGKPLLPPTSIKTCHSLVEKLASADHPMRRLLTRRALEVVRCALRTARLERPSSPPPTLKGLEVIAPRLELLARCVALLADHNRAVFGSVYDDILSS